LNSQFARGRQDKQLGLSDAILKVLDSIGYETPSPIQEQCIAHLLNGHDVIGQAQTGTGKTAAIWLAQYKTLENLSHSKVCQCTQHIIRFYSRFHNEWKTHGPNQVVQWLNLHS
jgi:superfamily II DNA/RNA helicase